METNKFAKPSEFTEPKQIKVLDFQRLKGEEAGSQFVDKWGFTNRLTFLDHYTQLERKIEISSYSFFKDFKNSGLKSGDECLALSLVLPDPRTPERSYRRWIFQKLTELQNGNQINNTGESGNSDGGLPRIIG